MKKEVEIFDEGNYIIIEDEYATNTVYFYPIKKEFKISSSVKNDVHYNNSTIEYKISNNPIRLETRTVKLSHEPPLRYSIRDGVVLESEMNKEKGGVFDSIRPNRIKELKKDVEWSEVPIFLNHEINLYIISKHPEIISRKEYRRFLRQSKERIKKGISQVEEAVKNDTHDLSIHTTNKETFIWYPENETEEKARKKYYNLPKEKRGGSVYGKKLKYAEKFNKSLFNKSSSSYTGISDDEFQNSKEIIKYINTLLNEENEFIKKETEPKISTNKLLIISSIITLFLSWVVSWFVDINPLLIFIIVQIIAFLQRIIGDYIERILKK